jgi:hypothetical protein
MRGQAGLRGTNERILVSDKADAVRKTQCTHRITYVCSFACTGTRNAPLKRKQRIIPVRARSSPA